MVARNNPTDFVVPLRVKGAPVIIPHRRRFGRRIGSRRIRFTEGITREVKAVVPIRSVGALKSVVAGCSRVITNVKRNVDDGGTGFGRRLRGLMSRLCYRRGQ